MGIMDSGKMKQAKKGQGETNVRLEASNEILEAVLAELKTTNQWLAHISTQLHRTAVTS
jgi:hypothetical protein